MNNPFDYTPDAACQEAFRRLTATLESLRNSSRAEDIALCRELDAGKMLGVLVATDSNGVRHTLYAFSGQLGEAGFHHNLFTGPVFDYLSPDGYFKTGEREISRRNAEIETFQNTTLSEARTSFERARKELNDEIAAFKEQCAISKKARDDQRKSGDADIETLAALTRRSQFEKAELHRLKKSVATRLEPLASRLKQAETHLAMLKERRRTDSEALQQWLFSNFRVLNARGESMSLSEIFADTPMRIPPSGAGECCAPKLLQAAYLQGLQPVAMAEYWYGKPKGGEVRMHGRHYPACRGKCLPVLTWMLQGLPVVPPLDSDNGPQAAHTPEIIYENRWFCVVDKPSGMLSVPGKGKAISLQQWLENRYGHDRLIKMAHRLDRDTSGLIVATFGEQSFKTMQALFATRQIKKSYTAILDGDYTSRGNPRKGRITLPLSPDWFDRPRQRVDFDNGKEAVTDYEFTDACEGRSRVTFHPLTGRTHQLRVHSASENGLGMPIAGDPLYGSDTGHTPSRLLLHARTLEFTFPLDGKSYSFESPLPF